MNINWIAPVGKTGYGIFSTNFLSALKKLDIDINVIPTYMEEIPLADKGIKELIDLKSTDILDADVIIKTCISNPSDIIGFHGKKRIYYTLLEADRIPPYWVRALNTVDEVWTMSEWGKKSFIDSGVKTPIKVMQGGVDLNIFNPNREPLFPKSDKFRFLFVGKWQRRKGVDVLCKAFAEEFSADEDVELFLACDSIKIYTPNYNIFEALFNLKLGANRANIRIVQGILDNYQDMGRYYTSADCFVNPTRGEGWNLPLIEAMASGLPCITTNWSAHTEYTNEDNCILLDKYKLEKANDTFLEFGNWAEPNIDELKQKMRWVFENREEAQKIGDKAADDMQGWTWDKAAKKVKKRLEEIVDG
jgi:glycosyltransferase involved in cell wall biosynthesis